MAVLISRVELARMLRRLNQYSGPTWTVAPVVTSAAVEEVLGYTPGTVTGYPVPTVTYEVLVNDVSVGPPPYTVQLADAGKTIKVRGTAVNQRVPAGVTSTSAGVVVEELPRLTISGKNILDENGASIVLRGVVAGHGELVRDGDHAEAAAMGANFWREGTRWWGNYDGAGGFIIDSENDADPGDIDADYLARFSASVRAAKAAGMRVIHFCDSNCGQGAESGGVCDLGSGDENFWTPGGAGKRAQFIAMVCHVVTHNVGYIDFIEPIVEPSAAEANQTTVWAFQEELMTAVLAIDPKMLFIIGPYPNYESNSIANAFKPAWGVVGNPFYQKIVITGNFLSNLCTNATNRVDRHGKAVTARNNANAPYLSQQLGTMTSADADDMHLAATLKLFDETSGGAFGYTYWEMTSVFPGSYGWYYLSDDADPNSARVLKPTRKAVLQAHWSGVPYWMTAPVIVGTPTVGELVTYTSGFATGRPFPTLTARVRVNGVDKGLASSYVIQAGDVGLPVVIRQTATNTAGAVTSDSAAVNAAGVPGGGDTYASLGINGTNIGPNYDYQTRIHVNLLHSLRCWCPLTDNGGFGYSDVTLVTSGAQKGYPAAGESCIGIFLNVVGPDDYGAYLFECDTNMVSKITNRGDGSFNGTLAYNSGTGKTTGTLTVSSGTSTIAIEFDNVNSGFGGLKLHAPGYALNTTQKIRTEAIAHFDFAGVLRFMDWLNTNGPEQPFSGGGNQDVNWAGSYAANKDSARGYKNSLAACYDMAAALDNRSLAVNIPAKFTDSAINSFIDECAALQSGDSTQITYVECPANEPWNGNLGESTSFQDLRTAAFTTANVYAGGSGNATSRYITSLARTSNEIVAGCPSHGLSNGASVYVKQKDDLFPAGTKTITVVDADTIKWSHTGSNATISHADDDTYILCNPSHTLCRNIGYHQPDPNCTANYVKIRYELTRAHVAAARVAAIGQTSRIKIIYGSWTAQPLNYVPCLLWAIEEYGDLDWLHSVATAFYVESGNNPGTIANVADVFSRMDTYVVDVKDRMVRWNNLMFTLGLLPFWYEWGPHLHLDGGNTTARNAIVAAHSDPGMATRMGEWMQWGRNFDQRVMCFFHSGVAPQPSQVNDCWPDTFGEMSDDATAVKHQKLVTMNDASAMPVQVDGLNFGTIKYVDVMPAAGALLGQTAQRLLINPSEKVEDQVVNVAVEADGNYTLALYWARHTDAAVAYTCYVDDVSVSTGNLPSVNVFTTNPGQAFTTTVALTAGNHKVRMHVPNASRADWVSPYELHLTGPL